MGLDQYLNASLYVSDYEHDTGRQRTAFLSLLSDAGIDDSHSRRCGTPSLTLSVTVAYWRKANQIHKWFVEHVQDGVDECRSHDVSREQLAELVDVCKQVLGRVVKNMLPGKIVAQQELAAKLLPTQDGFFFGSTDYDAYYLQDVERTVEMLEPVLADERLKDWDFEYQSSW